MRTIGTNLAVRTLLLILMPSVALLADAPSASARPTEGGFERAYFLEMHEGDLQAAAELYRTVIADPSTPKKLVQEARHRRQRCLEDLRSEDLAVLMPPETIAYVELRRPGRHVENLATMLGLVGDPLSNLRPGKRPPGISIPDTPGLVIPAEVT